MRATLAVLLAFSLVLTACSSDDSSPAADAVAGPLAEASQSEPASIPEDVAVQATTQTVVPPEPPPPVDVGVRSITVGGIGSEYAEPDRAYVDVGVSSRRPTVEESSRAAAAAGTAMTDALIAAGIEPRDIQSTEFSIYPYHEDWPAITGFETSLGYRVVMPNIGLVGSVLASAIDAGGDDVRAWGVRFEVDPTGLIDTARARAWADVESRAASLAALAGEPLGPVLDAHEKVLLSSSQGVVEGGEGEAAAFDIPVSPGVSGVIVLLTVTFAIGD